MGTDASTRLSGALGWTRRVLAMIEARLAHRPAPWHIGLSGLQGSGKSTLAAALVVLARRRGIDALALSLDDFYLGRRERLRLARTAHPLLATRGVPGTHDVGLIERTLDALAQASAHRPVCVPRFDKGRDTRLPPSRWRRVSQAPQLVVLEGWCVGVPAQDADALREPCNALERESDRDARWRQWVNAELAARYEPLWRRFDLRLVLRAPDFAIVARWREEAELVLRARGAPQAMDAAQLRRFVQHYERLSRHALRTVPRPGDVVLKLDARRRVRRLLP